MECRRCMASHTTTITTMGTTITTTTKKMAHWRYLQT